MSLSFLITTNKARLYNVPGCISNILSACPDAEILVLNQIDDLAFKKGQLYNLGVKLAKHPIIGFIDNDFRFLSDSKLNFEDIANNYKNDVVLPWSYMLQLKELEVNQYELIESNQMLCKGAGGFYMMSKDNYAKMHGHSNLYYAYGYEDLSLPIRWGKRFIRLNGPIGHIQHEDRYDLYEQTELFQENCKLWKTEQERDNLKDSWEHTIANIKNKVVLGQVIYYNIKDIDVTDYFGYPELLEKQKEIERTVYGLRKDDS